MRRCNGSGRFFDPAYSVIYGDRRVAMCPWCRHDVTVRAVEGWQWVLADHDGPVAPGFAVPAGSLP